MARVNQPSRLRPSRRRRAGTAYVLVLCTGVLLSVIGLGVLAGSRAASRSARQAADAGEAAVLAESGVAWGLAAVGADTAWRTTYANNVEVAGKAVGRGLVSFKLVDEADGNLSNSATDAVRLVGVGRVGSAARAYSAKLTAVGPVLDSLKNPVQAGTTLTITGNMTVSGGPLSANGTLTVSSGATVTGDVEGTSVVATGTVTGSKATLTTPRVLPVTSVFDTYKAQATTIAFSGISGGTVSNKVISAASNPYGTASAVGVYYIKVPSTGTLTIKSSRLVATLVVEVDPGGKVVTSGAWAWDPPRTDFPTLIVKAGTGSTVSLAGSSTALSEATAMTNFNPAGTPSSGGTTDTNFTGSYPAEFHGVLHVIGTGFTTTLSSYFTLKGALIAEGAVQAGVNTKLTADPVLSATPPVGYTAATTMRISPATWQWDPVN
ncbi:MAG: hypothetical protein JWO31_2096 [Phycisphaerales bacterium]|nr:hypothetical protein [Phycisphaerales bacterium]